MVDRFASNTSCDLWVLTATLSGPSLCLSFYPLRCYNCGEFANHVAAKCNQGPQPKKCHHCKAFEHLIADCPLREEKKSKKMNCTDSNGSELGSEEEILLNGHETASVSSEKNMSDSGIARSSSLGKTPTTDDTKSETSDGSRGRD